MVLNINVKLSGVTEQIVTDAVHRGYASTKTEVIRAGILALNRENKRMEALEEAETIKRLDAQMERIQRGEATMYTEKDLWRLLDEKEAAYKKELNAHATSKKTK